MKRLLLISNSTNPGEEYLSYPRQAIKDFLGGITSNIIFIPYAGVTFSRDEYEEKVNRSLNQVGITVKGIHRFEEDIEAVKKADAIIIGGGNTWSLVRSLREHELMGVIRQKIENGTPYIGWSAGSNVACPTLRTTNDMPIVDPKGFDTINLIPFQINPHYTDYHPAGHGGETRDDRINEFCCVNPSMPVVGLREGTMLLVEGDKMTLKGDKNMKLFKGGEEPKEYAPGDDLSFLLK
ncbi:dipeptidase PepE [Dysgonomonas massiliensis]|uniref:dipeptidase PepE n=1 Tax=Dysgonomonas massiliensis TaxID=2040292 RepID=UPI000C782941|nr:dipeptidase PepE [Dysgonomonas massiliensis]